MNDSRAVHTSVQAQRIAFLADTHWRSDEPSSQLVEALQGVDLIVHCGDIGNAGALQALGNIAPVLATLSSMDMSARQDGMPVRVLEANQKRIGVVFDLTKGDPAVEVGDTLAMNDVPAVLTSRFGGPVDAVAFAATHNQMREEHEG